MHVIRPHNPRVLLLTAAAALLAVVVLMFAAARINDVSFGSNAGSSAASPSTGALTAASWPPAAILHPLGPPFPQRIVIPWSFVHTRG